jgi:AcrR family transcriptional regulator
MTPPETRERLLDAAERQFAEHGFAGASLREITAEAEANLAAVSYHFGSKEELFLAVVTRVIAPINQQRLELLDRAKARAKEAPLPVEEVIEILVGPVLRSATQHGPRGGCLLKLFARTQLEDATLWKRIVDGPLREVKTRIEAELARALPHLGPREIAYRMHFTMGAVKSVAGELHMLKAFSHGLCDPTDIEGTLRELVAFLAAGMRAGAKPRRAANTARRSPKERSK